MLQNVDEVVILEKPPFFSSVSEVYDDFSDLSVQETLDFIKVFESEDHTIHQ